jgi:hypothetical protein
MKHTKAMKDKRQTAKMATERGLEKSTSCAPAPTATSKRHSGIPTRMEPDDRWELIDHTEPRQTTNDGGGGYGGDLR